MVPVCKTYDPGLMKRGTGAPFLCPTILPAEKEEFRGKVIKVKDGIILEFIAGRAGKAATFTGRYGSQALIGCGYNGCWPSYVQLETPGATVEIIEKELITLPNGRIHAEIRGLEAALYFNSLPSRERIASTISILNLYARSGLIAMVSRDNDGSHAKRILGSLLKEGTITQNGEIYSISEEMLLSLEIDPEIIAALRH